jgi:hypothetical protein
MPKLGGMAQISRPFQVALLAFAVLVLAWFVVLHRPGAGSTSSSAPSVPSASSASSGSSAGGTSSVYHGSAPGVEGLTRDVRRAHGAATQVEQNARAVQSRAAQLPGETAGAQSAAAGAAHGATDAAGTHTRASAGTRASSSAAVRTHVRTHASRSGSSSAASRTAAALSQRTPRAQHGSAVAAPSKSTPQAVIAAELKQGKVVLLLFWNPRSSDDAAVERQTLLATHKLGHGVAMQTALARQVNSFGSITRDIQVYQTPTLLVVNPHRQVTTLTGYTDAYAIEQAVAEARG